MFIKMCFTNGPKKRILEMLLKIQNFNLQSIFDTSFGLASDGDVLSTHPLWKMISFYIITGLYIYHSLNSC